MAQIAMGALGAGVGAFFGNPMLGFSIGMTVGGLLFPPKGANPGHGPLDDLRVSGSGYGVPIPQIFGNGRIAGNVLWARNLVEHKSTEHTGSKLSGQSSQKYTYTCSFAVGVCRGPIVRVRRIWADDILIYDANSAIGEVQRISVGTNTGGYFTAEFRGVFSAHIAWNATTAAVQAAIEGMSSIGVGNIAISGSDGGPWTASFIGTLANQDVPRMDMSNGTLTGGHGEGITTVTQGATYNITHYVGDETQVADPLIESFMGVGSTPAYRGWAYTVFTDLDLTPFGNRPPSMTFEVDRNGGTIHVSDIVTDLFTQAGLTSGQWDVSAATATVVRGFQLTQRQSVATQLEPLLNAFFFDLTEVDGVLRLVARGGASVKTVTAGELASWTAGAGSSNTGVQPTARVTARRQQDLELPQRLEISYLASNALFVQRTASSTRFTKTHQMQRLVAYPLVLTELEARTMVERTMDQFWVEREQFSVALPLSYLLYAPADILEVPVGVNTLRLRVTKQDAPFFGSVNFDLVLDDENILTQVAVSDTASEPTVSSQTTETTALFWTGNAVTDADTLHTGIYVAAYGPSGSLWPGATLYWSRDSGDTYQELATLTAEASVGYVKGVVPAPAVGTWDSEWDTVTTITAVMQSGTPTSVTDGDVMVGKNYCLVGNEIVQFVTATPTANPNEYALTRLLRGQRGTDGYMSTHVDGEKFVLLLDADAVTHIELDESSRGKSVLLKAVTGGSTIAATEEQALTISGDEWKCYSSCAGAGARDGGLNLTITWTGRSRSGAELRDWTDVDDPDLPESYEVDVMSGASVVRTITGLSAGSATYTAAQQVSDFGSAQPSVAVNIYRLGRYGRGFAYGITV